MSVRVGTSNVLSFIVQILCSYSGAHLYAFLVTPNTELHVKYTYLYIANGEKTLLSLKQSVISARSALQKRIAAAPPNKNHPDAGLVALYTSHLARVASC